MADVNSIQRHKVKAFVKELENFKGRHTELVSVYVPAGYDINKIVAHLSEEQGTATNIKSKQTRDNVISALERMLQHLKLYKKTPPNGLVVFAGNVTEREGQQDYRVWALEPPVPLNQRLYRCDKEFVLEPLREMMEDKNIYGMVVMDKREATLAFLKGKTIIPLTSASSAVPGKHKSGGQCLVNSSLIQSSCGHIVEIEKSHNPMQLMSMINDFSLKKSPIKDKWSSKKVVYKIITKFPRLELECSKDHLIFVREDKIIEKPAEELKKGDYLLMPEIIKIEGENQKLDVLNDYNLDVSKTGINEIINARKAKKLSQKELGKKTTLGQSTISAFELKKINLSYENLNKILSHLSIKKNFMLKNCKKTREVILPKVLDKDLAKIVGYFIGDGSFETDRISFSEQSEDVAISYHSLIKNKFKANTSINFRKDNNYYNIRVYSAPLVRYLQSNFPELKKALDTEIPLKIMQSKNKEVAAFINGLFDAEGYVSGGKIGIGMNNKKLIQQLQMLLLRFSIISSFLEYDNKKNKYSNNPRFTLEISEKQSAALYQQNIGFSGKVKSEKLNLLISKKTNKSNVRQILTTGKNVRIIIENAGYNLQLFPKTSSFFYNKRQMSKIVFKNSIISNVKDEKLKKELTKLLDIQILPVQINKIIKSEKIVNMTDISVHDQSFIANGIIVHNSAQRFERLRDLASIDFYNRIAEYMKENFFPKLNDLKGILVGGPGHTKQEFVEGGYITDQLRRKIIAVKDLSYTDEFGLQELLQKCEDVLSNEEVMEERKIMAEFFEKLSKSDMAAYGEAQVTHAIQMGAADRVLLSESLDDSRIEEYENLASQFGTKIILISVETREGAQLRDIGKVAAILRFKIEH